MGESLGLQEGGEKILLWRAGVRKHSQLCLFLAEVATHVGIHVHI